MTLEREIDGFDIFSYSIRRFTVEERRGEFCTSGTAGVRLLISGPGQPGVKNGRDGTLGLAGRKS